MYLQINLKQSSVHTKSVIVLKFFLLQSHGHWLFELTVILFLINHKNVFLIWDGFSFSMFYCLFFEEIIG